MTKRLAYSIAEAAEAIGVSEDTVYRLIQRGEVHSVLVGKRRLVPSASLLKLLGMETEEAQDRAHEQLRSLKVIDAQGIALSAAATPGGGNFHSNCKTSRSASLRAHDLGLDKGVPLYSLRFRDTWLRFDANADANAGIRS